MSTQKTNWRLATIALLSIACSRGIQADESVPAPSAPPVQHDLSHVGKELANPLGNLWALFTEFDFSSKRGSLTGGTSYGSFDMLFQPVMPFPITKDWKMITRPTIPIVFSTPVPEASSNGSIDIGHTGGFGDIELPLLLSKNPSKGSNWMFGAGPTFSFPSGAHNLGSYNWEVGPAAVVVYKPKKFTAGVLTQYWWSFARDSGSSGDTNHGMIMPFFFYDLPDAWQVGFNPTITYNGATSHNNNWNVPVGITIAKVTKVGKMPLKIQVGFEYSVVREVAFSKAWMFKINLIPVIKGLVQDPIF